MKSPQRWNLITSGERNQQTSEDEPLAAWARPGFDVPLPDVINPLRNRLIVSSTPLPAQETTTTKRDFLLACVK